MNWKEKYLNKVIQGDCLDVMKELPDKCIDLVLTDPPYGVKRGERKRGIMCRFWGFGCAKQIEGGSAVETGTLSDQEKEVFEESC